MDVAQGLLIFVVGLLGGLALVGVLWVLRRRGGASAPVQSEIHVMAERIRAVGKLVGLEVSAKEIATATKGWAWLPPLLLSQARLAMIFQFEKQYHVDLTRVRAEDVEILGDGRYRLWLPPIEGSLRLLDVTPYDIQDGRVLGLLDIIQMNASTQQELMRQAQEQASKLFVKNDPRYLRDARESISRQLHALLALFDAEVEVVWRDDLRPRDQEMTVEAGAIPVATA